MDLRYHTSYSSINNEYSIIELPHDILKELKKQPKGIHIVGAPDNEAVLCTEKNTFRIRKAETSNMSFLIPMTDENNISINTQHKSNSLDIYSTTTSYYELQKIAPRLSTLKTLLSKSEYDPELNEPGQEIGYTFEELQNTVQASTEELKLGLVKERAFFFENKWQILSDRYERELFSLILLCIQSNNSIGDTSSNVFNNISLRTIYNSVSEELMNPPPLRIVRHLLRLYSSDSKKEKSDEIYELDILKIIQFYAVNILKQNNTLRKMKLNQFMDKWNAQCPSDSRPRVSQLRGIALKTSNGLTDEISYFPVSELSDDIPTRFKQLFSFQPKWTLKDIQPYLNDIAHSLTVEQLLFKYTRSSQTNEGKIFTKR